MRGALGEEGEASSSSSSRTVTEGRRGVWWGTQEMGREVKELLLEAGMDLDIPISISIPT